MSTVSTKAPTSTVPSFLRWFFSKNEYKAQGEWFFVWYTFAWVGSIVAVVVFQLYKEWEDMGFNVYTTGVFLGCVAIPLIFPGGLEKQLPWHERYTTKANLWIFLFGFVGNYFWTHYFFVLLDAKYSFPLSEASFLNKVPILCFLLTQAYFSTYHVFTCGLLRLIKKVNIPVISTIIFALSVLVISLIWAFIEAWTLENFPYYSFSDRMRMYVYGSCFYALYFIVSFPMFLRLEEGINEKWSLERTAIEALAAAMIVFTLCDFWRLIIGNINTDLVTGTLPFLESHLNGTTL